MIALFKVAYWFVAILEFLVAVASIIIFAVQRSVFIEACENIANEDFTPEECSDAYRNFMIIYSIVLMVLSFVQVSKCAIHIEWVINRFHVQK